MSGRNLPIGDRYRVHGIDRAVFDIEGLVDRDSLRFGPILGQILCNFAGMGIALGLFAAVIHWPIKEQPVARLAGQPAQ